MKKKKFVEMLLSTGREGVENVIVELGKMGFFEAPASARFHLNQPGGLLEHSMNVCKVALSVREQMLRFKPELSDRLPEESVIIASLLHDVCKTDVYRPSVIYKKTNDGKWDRQPGYEVDYSNLPLGHGEKSVIMLQMWGLKLTVDEILAIRWHMTAWELAFHSAEQKANLNAARNVAPLCTVIQTADSLASNLLEN
jgi:hypothetical protein